jgi:three-Cys-motif partner protein
MKESEFFERQTISSKIKANIVSEYFPSYCKIIASKYQPKELRYIDLFAGPGAYKDGSPSTPLLIGRYCKNDAYLRQNVKMIFNDNRYFEILEKNFLKEFPAGTFQKKPHFGRSTVGEHKGISDFLKANTHIGNKNEYPSLLFIDPFGYKGIETKILSQFLRNWGNEIFIFVNTKRIHPALENDKFEGLMLDIFPTTFQKLKNDRRFKSTVPQRLNLIIDSLGEEYSRLLDCRIFYTAFKFQEEDSDTTSHYILHLTKGARGYDLIKTTYNDFANVGTVFDGVNTYTFDAKKHGKEFNELFDIESMNIENLSDDLFKRYYGKKLCTYQLFEIHHTGGLYSKRHYTEALRKLFNDGKLEVEYTDGKNHKVTVLISKDCTVKFK